MPKIPGRINDEQKCVTSSQVSNHYSTSYLFFNYDFDYDSLGSKEIPFRIVKVASY